MSCLGVKVRHPDGASKTTSLNVRNATTSRARRAMLRRSVEGSKCCGKGSKSLQPLLQYVLNLTF